jgi:Na+-transporting methylmalonyl-CoA/oxaloacetate decarboxylase gamma subunit
LSEFNQGLVISAIGLLVTFLALGIFILIMILLKKLFPYKEENQTGEKEDEETYAEPNAVAAMETLASEEEEMAAAIASLIYLRGQQSTQLGASLLEGPGRYWAAKQQTKNNGS